MLSSLKWSLSSFLFLLYLNPSGPEVLWFTLAFGRPALYNLGRWGDYMKLLLFPCPTLFVAWTSLLGKFCQLKTPFPDFIQTQGASAKAMEGWGSLGAWQVPRRWTGSKVPTGTHCSLWIWHPFSSQSWWHQAPKNSETQVRKFRSLDYWYCRKNSAFKNAILAFNWMGEEYGKSPWP